MKISVLGAALGTTNMGVSALAYSIIESILLNKPDAQIVMHDYQEGLNRKGTHCFLGNEYQFIRNGINLSKKIWKYESIYNLKAASRYSFLNNPIYDSISDSDLALSMTGGDSFTDLYGERVFNAGIWRKELVLSAGVPLVLLPQTYGPFSTKEHCSRACKTILKAEMAWARDEKSYDYLKELLGDHFDPERHKLGVDVAFALVPNQPRNSLTGTIAEFLRSNRTSPAVGLNISGLIYNDKNSKTKYSHTADYEEVLDKIISYLMSKEVNLILVPHVMAPVGYTESDYEACLKVAAKYETIYKDRIAVLSSDYDQNEIKWIISKFDWFCGTRMHSTIAALSTNVPTATIAYSIKAYGVFKICGQEKSVADLRMNSAQEIVDIIKDSYINREKNRKHLQMVIPGIRQKAVEQFDEVLNI